MPARSLRDLAQESCIRNVRDLSDLGNVPYAILRPILLKIQNPYQLKRLEEISPQICETETEANDAEIWMNFIKSDIPQWEKKLASLDSPTISWDLYEHLRQEDRRQLERDSEELKAKLKGIKDEKAKHTSRVLDPSEIPRSAVQRRKIAATGTRNLSTSILTFASGSRTKTTTGASVLKKVAREAKEIQHFGARASLSTPSHRLGTKAGQVTTAPRGIAQNYQVPVIQANGILSQAELERRKQAKADKAGSSHATPSDTTASKSASPSSTRVKRTATGDAKYGTTKSPNQPLQTDSTNRPIKMSRTKCNFFDTLRGSTNASKVAIRPPSPLKQKTPQPSEDMVHTHTPVSPTASLFSSASPTSNSTQTGNVSPKRQSPRRSPLPQSSKEVGKVKKIRRVQQTDPMMRRPTNAAKRRMGA